MQQHHVRQPRFEMYDQRGAARLGIVARSINREKFVFDSVPLAREPGGSIHHADQIGMAARHAPPGEADLIRSGVLGAPRPRTISATTSRQ